MTQELEKALAEIEELARPVLRCARPESDEEEALLNLFRVTSALRRCREQREDQRQESRSTWIPYREQMDAVLLKILRGGAHG